MEKSTAAQRRSESDNTTRQGPTPFSVKAYWWVAISRLGAELLQSSYTLVRTGKDALAEPAKSMCQTAVTGVVGIMGGKHMQPWREWPDA